MVGILQAIGGLVNEDGTTIIDGIAIVLGATSIVTAIATDDAKLFSRLPVAEIRLQTVSCH